MTSSLLRGLVSVGLYLALLLGPLAAAALFDPLPETRGFLLELSSALGFVAFALLAAEFALVARLRTVSALFGTDVLALFHRQMGIAALLFALAHPLLLLGRGLSLASLSPFSGPWALRSGALATWAALLLVLLALWRRRSGLRYEWWLALHGLLALGVTVAMTAHVLLIGSYASSGIVRWTCVAYAACFLASFAHHRLLRPLLAWRRPWSVVENRDEGADVRTLVLRPEGHAGLEFQPGQFVWLGTDRTPFGWQQHPLTISSSAEQGPDRSLELSIKDLGDWSGTLVPRLRPGTRVWIDGPFGAFTPERAPAEGFVLVAGGIGVTPMRSILLTMRDRADRRPVLLVYASRDLTRAPFVHELAALRAELALRVVHVLELPPPDWDGARGFVDAELLRRELPDGFRRWQFFVCGPGPMMGALDEALAALGVPADRIHTERFDLV